MYCHVLLTGSALATDYEERSFASLAPKATAHFADEFDRRGLQSITEHGQCGGRHWVAGERGCDQSGWGS